MNNIVRHWKKVLTCAMAITLCFPMAGCYDREELEQQAFVTTLGIDKAPNNTVDCTFRFAVPQNPSGGGGGGGGDQPPAAKGPLMFRARSITEALILANSTIEREVTMTQLSAVIFGQDMAQQGLKESLQTLTRYREFRPTTLVAVCQGKASDVMSAQKPILDKSMTRVMDGIAISGNKTGLIPIVYVSQLRRSVEDPKSGCVLPLLAVNHKVKDDPKGEQGVQGGVAFKAGEVARAGGDPVEWMGSAVLLGDKMIGTLTGRETIALRFMRGDLNDTRLDFPDPYKPGTTIGMAIKEERSPRYSIDLSSPVHIVIDVPMEADVLNVQSAVDYTQPGAKLRLESYVSKTLSDEYTALLSRMLNQERVDVIPVENHIRRKFRTHQAYTAYDWAQAEKTAQVEVHVHLNIRRYGVQLIPL